MADVHEASRRTMGVDTQRGAWETRGGRETV